MNTKLIAIVVLVASAIGCGAVESVEPPVLWHGPTPIEFRLKDGCEYELTVDSLESPQFSLSMVSHVTAAGYPPLPSKVAAKWVDGDGAEHPCSVTSSPCQWFAYRCTGTSVKLTPEGEDILLDNVKAVIVELDGVEHRLAVK